MKDDRIFEPHDLRRGRGQKRIDSAKSRIASFYNDVVFPHLLDPVRQGSNQNIAVIRLPTETDAIFLVKELEALMQQTYKNGRDVEFLVFNSKNKNIPQLGNSSDWLGKEAIDLPANNVPKIAIILNSYLQGFTIPAKNRIAFWHDLYKSNPMNNTASEGQSVGRNFGYPIEGDNGTKILLSSLSYPLFASRKVCEFSRDFYEWCDKNAGLGGEIKNFNTNSHVWTNSSVKKARLSRKSYKVRNHHGGKSREEVEAWWRDNINDRSVNDKIGTTTCEEVNKRDWAREIANDRLGGHLKKGRNSCGLYGIISFKGVVWDPSNDDHIMILKKYPEVDPNSSSYVGDFLYVDCENHISNKTTFTNKTAATKYLK